MHRIKISSIFVKNKKWNLERKKNIGQFIEEIDKDWKLTLNEEEFLDSVFNLILQGESEKVADIVYLYCSSNYDELLELIPDSDIEYYAQRNLGLIEDVDCDCEEQRTLGDFDDDDIKEEYFDRFEVYKKSNIIRDMNSLFLSLTPQKQIQAIELLKTI